MRQLQSSETKLNQEVDVDFENLIDFGLAPRKRFQRD